MICQCYLLLDLVDSNCIALKVPFSKVCSNISSGFDIDSRSMNVLVYDIKQRRYYHIIASQAQTTCEISVGFDVDTLMKLSLLFDPKVLITRRLQLA